MTNRSEELMASRETGACLIEPLQAAHSQAVARLHLEHLTTSFRGKSGLELLAIYYREVSKGQGGCGYVALVNGEIVGYICGIWDGQSLRRNLLRRAWFPMIFWAFLQEISKTNLLGNLIGRFRQTKRQQAETIQGYELRPIVVSPWARGSGVAAKLLDTILQDAASRGYATIYLFAEPENQRANSFYEKNGFLLMGQKQAAEGFYNYYVRAIQPSV